MAMVGSDRMSFRLSPTIRPLARDPFDGMYCATVQGSRTYLLPSPTGNAKRESKMGREDFSFVSLDTQNESFLWILYWTLFFSL